MFNKKYKSSIDLRIGRIEKIFKPEGYYYESNELGFVRPFPKRGLEDQVKDLKEEIKKLKAIVAEVTNTVYGDKK